MSRKLTVVLVDDSKSVLKRQQALLSELDGVDVVGTATHGAEAIRVIDACLPDLVLMDIVMPGLDGLAALRMILARHPRLRVVMVSSAGGSESRASEAFRLGAVQVLGKPLGTDQLEALIIREREQLETGDAR